MGINLTWYVLNLYTDYCKYGIENLKKAIHGEICHVNVLEDPILRCLFSLNHSIDSA